MQAVAPSVTEMFERIEARERVRTLRMQRHLIVGSLAMSSLVVLGQFADTVAELALLPVLIGIAVRSLMRGVDAKFGHLWDWIYAEPLTPTRLDRLAGRLIDRASSRLWVVDTIAESPVRPLDPYGG